jgi:hypothetical protein
VLVASAVLRCHFSKNILWWAGSVSWLLNRFPEQFHGGGEVLSPWCIPVLKKGPRELVIINVSTSPWRLNYSFFMDFTVALIFPLLCGYVGVDVICRNPHVLAKSWNDLAINWGPWSDQKISGTPVRQNDWLRIAVKRGRGGGVVTHGDDVRPIWVATYSTSMRWSCHA